MTGASNEQLRWVGCLAVLGLVVALGFAGYRTWDGLSHTPPLVSTLPSARAKADAAPPQEKPPLPVEAIPTEQAAPGTHEQPRVALGGGSTSAPPNLAPRGSLCESVVDGLRILRPCTGAPDEVRSPHANSNTGRHPKCVVTMDGLSILRDCKGIPGERPAPGTDAH